MKNKVEILNARSLRREAVPVDEASLKHVVEMVVPQMLEVMKAEEGLGLAANQIDSEHAVFIIDIDKELHIFLNPEIIEMSEPIMHEEGCLSIPGVVAKVERSNRLTLKYQDENFVTHQKEFVGISAIAVQHEVDHLNGVLYIDHLGDVTRAMVLKRHKKYLKARSRLGVA